MTEERTEIVKEVLDRMDEICPAEDINMVEGQLIDSLIDNAMSEFLLMANIHKIPVIAIKNYPDRKVLENGELEDSTIENDVLQNVFAAPDDFIRLVSVSCHDWARTLYESDISDTTSLQWKLSTFKFNEPTRLKPIIAVLPMDLGNIYRFHISPYKGNGITLTYVPRKLPEDIKVQIGKNHGFWQAYIWYASSSVLSVMGQPENAAIALQHMQAYQVIPNGFGGMKQDK